MCTFAGGQEPALPKPRRSPAPVHPLSCPAVHLRGVGKGCCQEMDLQPALLCPRQALLETQPETPSHSPAPMGWDRPQPAGLPALINTGQAAKTAAGSILPGGPKLSRGHMGEGAAAWLRDSGGWGGAGQGRARKAGITHRIIHSFTYSLLCPHMFSPQIFSEHQLCTRHCHRHMGTL